MAAILQMVIATYRRLRGSTSPVLTATHNSYGSPRLSDFFPSRLWGQTPQRTFTQNGSNDVFSRKDVPFAATFHTP